MKRCRSSFINKSKILIYILFASFLINSFVYASDESFDLNLISDTNYLAPGSSINFTMKLSNINVTQGEGGIAGYTAKLVYDKDIFDFVSIKAENSKWNVSYSDGSIVAYREDTIALNNTGVTENGIAGTLQLKVKETATEGITKIKLESIVGGDTIHSVNGNTNEVEIRINSKVAELKNIEIASKPTKLVYTEGEKFSKLGLEVLANYDDGTSSMIENYTYKPDGELSVKDEKITVSYTENGVTKEASIDIKVNAKNNGENNTKDENKKNENNTTVDKTNETNTNENTGKQTNTNTDTNEKKGNEINTNTDTIKNTEKNTNVDSDSNKNKDTNTSKDIIKTSNSDNSQASKVLPKTGKAGMIILVLLVTIVLVMSIVGYRKYRGI